jgi:hypothetical protein
VLKPKPLVNARALALPGIKQGDEDWLVKIAQMLAQSGFTPAEIEEAVQSAREPVKKLTLREMLLAALETAEEDLRHNRIDGVESLIEWCSGTSWHQLPPQVRKFALHHFRRVGSNRLVFKRPAHRVQSYRKDLDRFYSDPNRLAAHYVRVEIARDQRLGRAGKPKERLARAIAKAKSLNPEVVRALLYHARGKRPVPPFGEDPNSQT